MRSTWAPKTERALHRYASGHLRYEIYVLLEQAQKLEELGEIEDAMGDALLEASLVHLRLLDDFLGSPQQAQPPTRDDPDDVFARHWLPGWAPRRFLTGGQRQRINAQLAHLSARRRWRVGWNVPALTTACCQGFVRFLDQLNVAHPRRARAFAESRARIEAWLARHTP